MNIFYKYSVILGVKNSSTPLLYDQKCKVKYMVTHMLMINFET